MSRPQQLVIEVRCRNCTKLMAEIRVQNEEGSQNISSYCRTCQANVGFTLFPILQAEVD